MYRRDDGKPEVTAWQETVGNPKGIGIGSGESKTKTIIGVIACDNI